MRPTGTTDFTNNISSGVHKRSVSTIDRSKLLQMAFKCFKSKARQGYPSLIIPRPEHFLPGTVFNRCEGDSWDMALTKPTLLGIQGLLICVSVVGHNVLPLRTGMCFEQKEGHDMPLHFHRVSAKLDVWKQ